MNKKELSKKYEKTFLKKAYSKKGKIKKYYAIWIEEQLVEILALSGVVKSLKDTETPTFEEWVRANYKKINNYTYQHKISLNKRDGHQVKNAYRLIAEHF